MHILLFPPNDKHIWSCGKSFPRICICEHCSRSMVLEVTAHMERGLHPVFPTKLRLDTSSREVTPLEKHWKSKMSFIVNVLIFFYYFYMYLTYLTKAFVFFAKIWYFDFSAIQGVPVVPRRRRRGGRITRRGLRLGVGRGRRGQRRRRRARRRRARAAPPAPRAARAPRASRPARAPCAARAARPLVPMPHVMYETPPLRRSFVL